MAEMVHRVAAAIIDQLRNDAEKFTAYESLSHDQDNEYLGFDEVGAELVAKSNGTYDGQIDAEAIARAAIEAMREPTEAMTAVWKTMGGNELCWDADGQTAANVFQAMIDAALSEKPNEQ